MGRLGPDGSGENIGGHAARISLRGLGVASIAVLASSAASAPESSSFWLRVALGIACAVALAISFAAQPIRDRAAAVLTNMLAALVVALVGPAGLGTAWIISAALCSATLENTRSGIAVAFGHTALVLIYPQVLPPDSLPWLQGASGTFGMGAALSTLALAAALLWLWSVTHAAAPSSASSIKNDSTNAPADRTTAWPALEARIAELERAEAVGKMTGRIAHDIGSRMQPVRMLADALADGDLSRESKEIASKLALAAERAGAVAKRLSQLAKGISPATSRFDAADAVRDGALRLLSACPDGISLKFDLSEAPLPIDGRPDEINRVLEELVDNAIRATTPPGEIRVVVQARHLTTAETFAHGSVPPGRWIELEVADSGPGMDSKTLASSLEPFVSGWGDPASVGIGFTLVRFLADAYGGHFACASSPGEGTSVKLFLPLAAPTPVQSDES